MSQTETTKTPAAELADFILTHPLVEKLGQNSQKQAEMIREARQRLHFALSMARTCCATRESRFGEEMDNICAAVALLEELELGTSEAAWIAAWHVAPPAEGTVEP